MAQDAFKGYHPRSVVRHSPNGLRYGPRALRRTEDVAGEPLDGGVLGDEPEVPVVLGVEPAEGHVLEVVEVVSTGARPVLEGEKMYFPCT